MSTRPLLVIFVDWFEPAYKAGGPVRSVSNLSRLLSSEAEIRIFTSDKDHGESAPLQGIQPDLWTDFAPGVRVWYTSDDSYSAMLREFRSLKPTAIYFNSLFSISYFLRPLLQSISAFPESRKVIAPRGMLHQGALQYGRLKKSLFLRLMKVMKWSEKLVWQATDQQERLDIERHIGANSEICDARNVPTIIGDRTYTHRDKDPDSLRALFVSRVQPKKNLVFFLSLLREFEGDVQFDIVGPIEDESYWNECQQVIRELPAHIQVRYLGSMPHASILALQQEYDLFVLPTFGENFGHSIYDALAGGLPVLISDQTPWRGLEAAGAGLDIPLDPEKWAKALSALHSASTEEWRKRRKSAIDFATQYIDSQDFTNQYHQLFFKE